jgi:[acyl-carrier-protein] S-malonyltransferase
LPYESPSEIPEALTKQLYQPVLWDKSIEYLIKNDVCTIVEMGPQNVLKNLIQESKAGVKVYAFDEQFDRECLQML